MVGFLEAGIDFAHFDAVIGHVSAVAIGVSGKGFFDIGGHALDIGGGFHFEFAPGEACHGIEEGEVEVVFGFASGLGEDFVEGEFLVEEGGAGVEREVADFEFGVSTADAVLFFDDGDIEAPMGEDHTCCEASGPGSDDDDSFFSHFVMAWESSGICAEG